MGKKCHKWTHGRVDKASDEVTKKTYGEYKPRELNEKGEKTGKALGQHVIILYSTTISRMVKRVAQEACDKEVRRKPRSLEFIPDVFKTQEIWNKVVKKDSYTLRFLPFHF